MMQPGQTNLLPADIAPIIIPKKGQSLAMSKPLGMAQIPINDATPTTPAPQQLLWRHESEMRQPHLRSMGSADYLIYLCTLPEPWECDLFSLMASNVPWNHPSLQMDNPLQNLLSTGAGPIHIISNAAMDSTRDSVCHWVVAIFSQGTQIKSWLGDGPIPGPASQAHTS